jgi:hypothetical protein
MAKKPIPPEDVIREESEPPITEVQEPSKKNPTGEVDIDDAQIDEPKDDAFRKAPQPGSDLNFTPDAAQKIEKAKRRRSASTILRSALEIVHLLEGKVFLVKQARLARIGNLVLIANEQEVPIQL